MGPPSFILSPCVACCTDVERIKLDGPGGGGATSTGDFLVNMFNRIKLRIQGLDTVQTPLLA